MLSGRFYVSSSSHFVNMLNYILAVKRTFFLLIFQVELCYKLDIGLFPANRDRNMQIVFYQDKTPSYSKLFNTQSTYLPNKKSGSLSFNMTQTRVYVCTIFRSRHMLNPQSAIHDQFHDYANSFDLYETPNNSASYKAPNLLTH